METGEKYRVKEDSDLHHYKAGDIITVDGALIPGELYFTHRDPDGLTQVMQPKQLEKVED